MSNELFAVNCISDLVAQCPHLSPYIAFNDKLPLTDGNIDIHSSSGPHRKETFQCRVDVQVKGKSIPKSGKFKASYPIRRADLEGYLKVSGVLYFVVFIDHKTHERHPYYALLNPFKIHERLQSMRADQKATTFALKPLPEEPEQIEQIVRLACKKKSESPEQVLDEKFFDDVQKIQLLSDSGMNINEPVSLKRSEQDFSVVFTTSGGISLPFPGDIYLIPEKYAGEQTELTLSSGGITFYNPVRKQVDPDTVEIVLSSGLKIVTHKTENVKLSGKINVSLQNNLGARAKDLAFFDMLKKERGFIQDGSKVQAEFGELEDVPELDDHFKFLQSVVAFLSHLGADPYLVNIGDMADDHRRQLHELSRAFFKDHEIVPSVVNSNPTRVRQLLGEWIIDLFVMLEKKNGKWQYRNLFDPKLEYQFAFADPAENKSPYRVTAYDLIDEDELPYVLNLRLNEIVPAYKRIDQYSSTSELATQMVLKLINAAELLEIRRDEFLAAAYELNEWLISKEGDDPKHLVNGWQIKLRQGRLTEEDRQAIRTLKRTATRQQISDPVPFEVACAILLEETEETAYSVEQLSEDELAQMRTWPIWRLKENIEN